jgi:hypothetical protein
LRTLLDSTKFSEIQKEKIEIVHNILINDYIELTVSLQQTTTPPIKTNFSEKAVIMSIGPSRSQYS